MKQVTLMYPPKRSSEFQAFRSVTKTGVIFVMSAASERGFYYGNSEWANLGQGAPETGHIAHGALRLDDIPLPLSALEYGNVAGINELRQAVADLYNQRYRKGKASQYKIENVAISPGGRSGLTRLAAAMDHCNLGHFIPDYTAYEELLSLFRDLMPIPILLRAEDGFKPTPELLRHEVSGMGLGAVLISNPCNPTGQVLCGDDLNEWVNTVRELHSFLILDEFYAHYHYDRISQEPAISAAAYVDDVNRDPVVILDGLTKNWRYPGLRICWTVGPAEIIENMASAGSFLDGGASHPIQRAVLPLLQREVADREARAIQAHFGHKRELTLTRLEELGFVLKARPQGSFYAFVSLENMPEPIRDGFEFFKKALEYKVICVPGVFFDVNPGKRRSHIPSRLNSYVRISYGPELAELTRGLDGIERMIKDLKS